MKGLQGGDPVYLKTVATPAYYAVHSGPENERHHFNAEASERDLRETYLPAFEATVREAGAYSVMGAYNRTNGEPCCASTVLLQKILRDNWDSTAMSSCQTAAPSGISLPSSGRRDTGRGRGDGRDQRLRPELR